jgi:membrane-associated protein
MLSIEQSIFDWLNGNSQHAIYLVPMLAFGEACIGVGLLISGVFLLIIATAIYSSELATIEVIGPQFHSSSIASRYRKNIDRAEELIRKYGAAAIFIGRFIPAIRSLIPATLGLSKFNPVRYSLMDALACALWSIVLGLIVVGLDLGFDFF